MGDTAGKIVGTHMIYEGQHLTDRELQVLDLASQGLTNREVGAKLGLAQETIKTHVRHYLAKLGARNTTHAVALGYQQGYLPKSTEGRRSA